MAESFSAPDRPTTAKELAFVAAKICAILARVDGAIKSFRAGEEQAFDDAEKLIQDELLEMVHIVQNLANGKFANAD